MPSKLRETTRDESGFTLIEILVVVLIIGLLSAIAIPIFTNQQEKGADGEAKVGAETAARALEACAVDANGRYDNPGSPCDKAALIEVEPSLADFGARLDEPELGSDGYTVTVHSKRAPSEISFSIQRRSDGTFDRQCEVGDQELGGCPHPGGSGPDW
jgi:prepilin-type N-terminal cleavage/methylation domain-containing protein